MIAEKVTGNNPRRQVFEGDVKAISDLQKLISADEIYANVPISPNGKLKYPSIDEDGSTGGEPGTGVVPTHKIHLSFVIAYMENFQMIFCIMFQQ